MRKINLYEAENKMMRTALEDIRARVREIKYHHTKPRTSRHGNTTHICADIESRIEIALNYNETQAKTDRD